MSSQLNKMNFCQIQETVAQREKQIAEIESKRDEESKERNIEFEKLQGRDYKLCLVKTAPKY